MKNLIRLFGFLFLFIVLPVNAQIDKEIKSYVDSTELLVNNGRKMIINRIMANDNSKAKEAYRYLSLITLGKSYYAFYYYEEIYLNILFEDWTNLETVLLDYRNIGNERTYQNAFDIYSTLLTKTSQNCDFLINECRNSSLDSETKDLVEILIYLTKNGSENEGYNLKLDEFEKKYPDTKYKDIVLRVLPKKKIKASFGFDLGAAYIVTTGKLKDNFSSNAGINFSMDFDIQKIYISLFVTGSSLKLKVPFSVINGTDLLDFNKNESFRYMNGGLNCGYFILQNSKLKLAPFISISGSSLKSDRYDSKDDSKEYKIFNSFAYGPGFHSELKLKEFKLKNGYYYGIYHSFVSVRLDGGYNIISKFNNSKFKGDTPYVMLTLLWGLGDF